MPVYRIAEDNDEMINLLLPIKDKPGPQIPESAKLEAYELQRQNDKHRFEKLNLLDHRQTHLLL